MKQFTFPDGQPHITLCPFDFPVGSIKTNITCAEDLLKLSMITNVLRRRGISPILEIGYLLGSRMERAISSNDPITLKCIAQIINSMGFSRVVVNVPHETKELQSLMRNVLPTNKLLWEIVGNTLKRLEGNVLLVAPDQGAVSRARECADLFNLPLISLNKKRDQSTGTLSKDIWWDESIYNSSTRLSTYEYLKTEPIKHVIIVDDLCDGGRTFINAAKFLREDFEPFTGRKELSLHLCVAHAIFSAGLDNLLDTFESINTSNTYPFSNSEMNKSTYASVHITTFETNL